MRTKTFLNSDAERLLRRAGVSRVANQMAFVLAALAPAPSATLSLNKHFKDKMINIRNSRYN